MTPRPLSSWMAPQFDRFAALRQSQGSAWTTQRRILVRFDRWIREHAPQPPISRSILLEYTRSLHRLTPGYWSGVIGVVWSAVSYAVRHGAPADGALGLRPRCPSLYRQTRAPRYVSDQEIRGLLAAARHLDTPHAPVLPAATATLIGLLWVTGLRISEALALDAADLDPREGTLTVRHGKFGKSRLLPLRNSVIDALIQLLEHPRRPRSTEPSTPLFVVRGRHRLTPNRARIAIRSACAAAQISPPYPRPHDFRHSFAVHCVARWLAERRQINTLLPILSAALGHVSVQDTRVYLTANGILLEQMIARFALSTHFLDQVLS